MTFLFCRIKLQEREPVTKITRTKAINSAPYVVTPEDTFIYYTFTIIFFASVSLFTSSMPPYVLRKLAEIVLDRLPWPR